MSRVPISALLPPPRLGRFPLALAAAVLACLCLLPAQTPAAHPRHSGRDPFKSLIPPPGEGKAGPLNLPGGKAGLLIDKLVVQGVAVGGPTGPVALVAEGAETFFLRPGDHIYDGVVVRIEPQGIVFQRTKAMDKTQQVGGEVTRAIAAGTDAP